MLFEETYYDHYKLMTPEEEKNPFARVLHLQSEDLAEDDPLIRRWRRYDLYGLHEKIDFKDLLSLPRYLVDEIFNNEVKRRKEPPPPPPFGVPTGSKKRRP